MDKILRDGIEVLLLHSGVQPLLSLNTKKMWQTLMENFSDLLTRRYPERYSRDDADNAKSMFNKLCQGKNDVFECILKFSAQSLVEDYGRPVVDYEQILRWRSLVHLVGSTPFVNAFLANKDNNFNIQRNTFVMPPVLPTNNKRLKAMLDKGMAENHFHLTGSTPSFLLTWIFLMNNIRECSNSFDILAKHKLSIRLNQEELYRLVYCAAEIRLFLFEKLYELESRNPTLALDARQCQAESRTFQIRLDATRQTTGQRILGGLIPDYALLEKNDDVYAVFSGENYFQYSMFSAILKPNTTVFPFRHLFFAYLMIASQFRSEMVQCNDNFGFDNFSLYQNRKGTFLDKHTKWKEQLTIVAARGNLSDSRVKSFEIRVKPQVTASKLANDLTRLNKIIRKACDSEVSTSTGQPPHKMFYVLHMPKRKDTLPKTTQEQLLLCRHESLRKEIEQYSNAIIKLRNSCADIAGYIRGIDACSREIGCRPEVFAQEFRRLRRNHVKTQLQRKIPSANLGVTYHVGEDFLDVVDGLRAIEEALLFFELAQGDRLGHALALGVDSDEWYAKKHNRVIISRQDLLDNCVFLYMELSHAGCLGAQLEQQLLHEFSKLSHYIYRSRMPHPECDYHISIIDYWDAWHLRGDLPHCYRSYADFEQYKANLKTILVAKPHAVLQHEEDDGYLQTVRTSNLQAIRLYFHYHYNPDVKTYGKEIVEFEITPFYREGARQLQSLMRDKLVRKNIGIEANPSSNVLIGNFNRYDKHPLLIFNDRHIKDSDENQRMFVSINTDDQGVFDTCLENEFALMARGMEQVIDEHGVQKYLPSNVYAWLDMLRQMGLEQSFGPTDNSQ